MRSALEVLSLAARTGSIQDPREPKGTRGGLSAIDIVHALGMCWDSVGADLALMIACHDLRKVDELRSWIVHEVTVRCNHDGIVPDLMKVYDAVHEAMNVAVFGGSHRGGSRYFRWAYREIMSRAEEAAEEAVRRLRRAA